ncbi:MAG: oligosaccharide flippase family protein [Thermosphaera sp.]
MSGGGWVVGGKVVTALAGLGSSVLLARMLSPEELGVYFLAYSLVMFTSMVGRLGLDRSIVRNVAENMGLKRFELAGAAVDASFKLVLLGASFAGLLYLVAAPVIADTIFNAPALMMLTVPVVFWIVAYVLLQFFAEAFRGFHDIRLATLFSTVSYRLLLVLGLGVLWLAGEARLSIIILLSVVSTWSSVAIAGWLLHHRLKTLSRLESDASAEPGIQPTPKSILALSLPLMVSKLALFALAQSGIWIVGAVLTQEDVAIFGLVMRLLNFVVMPLIMVQEIVSPMIAEMHVQRKLHVLEPVLRTTATLLGLPSILLLLGFVTFGEAFLSNVFGPFYGQGALVLIILSLGQVVNVLAGACAPALMMTGHQVVMMRITVLTGAATILLGILAAQHFGLIGLAAVMASGMIVQNILMVAYVKLKLEIWTQVSLDIRDLKKALGV